MSFSLIHNQTNIHFKVLFQPIVELKSNSVVAMEALSRVVSGDDINIEAVIEQVSQEGSSQKFTIALVKEICSLCEYIPEAVRYLSINVTMDDLTSLKLCGYLEDLMNNLSERNIKLVIEIPEAQQYPDPSSKAGQALINNIKILRLLGVFIAIDDFGKGYNTTESMVHELKPNVVKIDKEIVQNPHKHMKTWRAIESVQEKCDVKIVAEGVESMKELYHVIEKGIQFGQGYYFGRPASL